MRTELMLGYEGMHQTTHTLEEFLYPPHPISYKGKFFYVFDWPPNEEI